MADCHALAENHLMLDYDEVNQKFLIKLLDERAVTQLNGNQLSSKSDEWYTVNDLDELRVTCGLHSEGHVWRIQLSNGGLKVSKKTVDDATSS